MAVIFLFSVLYTVAAELKAVVEVSRHGARAPLMQYEWCEWTPQLGELTELGMRQHYLLGAEFRHRYIVQQRLLGPLYNASEVYIRSTHLNRTQMSAQSQLIGWFPEATAMSQALASGDAPPFKVKDLAKVKEALGLKAVAAGFQPVPIYIENRAQDYMLLGYTPDVCPKIAWYIEQQQQSEAYLARVKEFNAPGGLGEIMNLYFNGTFEFGNSSWFADALFAILWQGYELPNGLPYEVYKAMDSNKDFIISYFLKGDASNLASSEFLKALLEYFESVQKGETALKFKYYSAHDVTLNAFRIALDFFDGVSPPFASTLIFELHEEEGGLYTVKILYNDSEILLNGCSDARCPLEEFKQFVKPKLVADVAKECHSVSLQQVKSTTLIQHSIISSTT